jgi:hypothetical protein
LSLFFKIGSHTNFAWASLWPWSSYLYFLSTWDYRCALLPWPTYIISKAGFLNFGFIAILEWVILCCEGHGCFPASMACNH